MADGSTHIVPERSTKRALRLGWRRLCPNCGSGPMMKGYLKVHDHCPVCQEPLHHQRADDGPSYITILVLGHILAPMMLFTFERWEPDPLLMATGFAIAFVAAALWLLPRVKGALVGLQWAKRMHGFGQGHPTSKP